MQESAKGLHDIVIRFNLLYAQSFSNLQADSFDAIRNIVHAYVSAQEQTATNSIFWRSNPIIPSDIWRRLLLRLASLGLSFLTSNDIDASNLAKRQLDQYPDYEISVIVAFSNIAAINLLNATRENIRIYER